MIAVLIPLRVTAAVTAAAGKTTPQAIIQAAIVSPETSSIPPTILYRQQRGNDSFRQQPQDPYQQQTLFPQQDFYAQQGYTAQPQSGFQPTYPQQDSAYRQPAAGYTNPVMPGANYPARQEGYYNAEYGTSNPAVPEMIEAGECD